MQQRPSQAPSSQYLTITNMQQRSSPSTPYRDLAFVPFAWEEKPGVPKQQENSLLVSIHTPAPQHPPLSQIAATLPCPLSEPPCLQPHADTRVFHKSTSFKTIRSPPVPRGHVTRKQSFDSVTYEDEGCRKLPMTRRYSHGSLIMPVEMQQKRSLQPRKEDDPFLMAIQACRKEPIRVFYQGDRIRAREERKGANDRMQLGRAMKEKHLTIRQLFTQQLQEEERLHIKLAQKQPLIAKKKQANGPFLFLARCLGCYYS
ncbi:hypothetical protein L7F22_057836 [Adiantum nelumboides]|nr:hypothetical protein [Adiantum nelumboides]